MGEINKKTWRTAGLVIAGIAVLIASFFAIQTVKRNAIVKKIVPNIMLLKHNFIYYAHIEFNDGIIAEIHLVKLPDNNYDIYNPDSTLPNMVVANAIMINDSGDCLTSAYAAEPWNNEREKGYIYEHIAKETQGQNVKSITISGRSLYLTITPTEVSKNGDSAMEYIRAGGDRSIATISRKYKTGILPVSTIEYETTTAEEVFDKKRVLMFALPDGIDKVSEADHKEVKINSAVLSDYSVLVLPPVKNFLNEGAPLFNKDGKLIAITTQRFAEHHERAGENIASVINVKGKPPYDVKRRHNIDSLERIKKEEEANKKQAETDITNPFPEEKGWIKISEETHSVADTTEHKSDFSLEHTNPCRLRIKYKPGNSGSPNLQISVYRSAWDPVIREHLPFLVKEITISKEGSSADTLGLLFYGNYKLEIKHAGGDLYRIIIEQKEFNY